MSKLEEFYDKLPDGILDKIMPAYGQVMTTVANNDIGRGIIQFSHMAAGKVIGGALSLTGIANDESPAELVRGFVEKFFGEIVEFEEDGGDELVFSFDSCPYGFCGEEQADLCHSAMNLEEEVVDSLGGELIIEERIPEGAEKCRFRVRTS